MTVTLDNEIVIEKQQPCAKEPDCAQPGNIPPNGPSYGYTVLENRSVNVTKSDPVLTIAVSVEIPNGESNQKALLDDVKLTAGGVASS